MTDLPRYPDRLATEENPYQSPLADCDPSKPMPMSRLAIAFYTALWLFYLIALLMLPLFLLERSR